MTPANRQLEQDTKTFWELTQIFNGRSKATTTVETALKKLGKITKGVYGSSIRLPIKAALFRESIIHNNKGDESDVAHVRLSDVVDLPTRAKERV